MKKIAVIIFNLGSPDQLDSIEPFLFNLFNDRAIIDLPNPFRWALARFISARRKHKAQAIYQQIGGKSPLLDQTRDQADALEQVLNETHHDHTFKSFIAMRYWHPMSGQTAHEVMEYGPDQIVLLPLYPQYSSATTGSSVSDWQKAATQIGLNAPTEIICCYPKDAGWIEAQRDLISKVFESCRDKGQKAGYGTRILFSAHGLPKKIIDKGDPYQWQIEQTCEAIISALGHDGSENIDWAVCYQSRVGRLEWIGPSINQEIQRAADDKVGIIVVPVAFVSEHSETLVELDIQYRDVAADLNVICYDRIPAVATHHSWIKGLAELVGKSLQDNNVQDGQCIFGNDCRCLVNHTKCPNNAGR